MTYRPKTKPGAKGATGPAGGGGAIVANVIGNGTVDDTLAIQTAIDQACSQQIKTIVIPDGKTCKITSPLFLDPPGNLRSNVNNPTNFNFSLTLQGGDGISSQGTGFGVRILPSTNNFVPLWVGPGQGMHVKGLEISGTGLSAGRQNLNPNVAGIAISGGGGGAHITLIENCYIANFYHGIATGFNIDALCDSNTIRECAVTNCYRGIAIIQSQNFINDLDQCVVSNCNIAVYNPHGLNINIRGGNYSSTLNAGSFAITGVSTITNTSGVYTITAVVTSPDGPMVANAYDLATILTTGFGLVAFEVVSFNGGTSVITLSLDMKIFSFYYYSIDPITGCDLQAELQVATTLHCVEMFKVFDGVSVGQQPGTGKITARGLHFENGSYTRLFEGMSSTSCIEDCYFNYPPSGALFATANFYAQQAFPFIRLLNSNLSFGNINSGFSAANYNTESVVIYMEQNCKFTWNKVDLWAPNLQCNNSSIVSSAIWDSRVAGFGNFDGNPFVPVSNENQFISYARNQIEDSGPMRGYRPDPNLTQRISADSLAAIMAGPGALGTYPRLNGQTVYSVANWNSGALPNIFARSAHEFYSYGQNLSVNWSYKGQTAVITVSGIDKDRLFPGLKIILNNGTDGDIGYIVQSVHTKLGYINVVRLLDNTTSVLVGSKTTTYTGSVIKQEAYSVTQYG